MERLQSKRKKLTCSLPCLEKDILDLVWQEGGVFIAYQGRSLYISWGWLENGKVIFYQCFLVYNAVSFKQK